jgi:hypothetical protein
MGTRITTALPDMMGGFERNTTIEGRQQDICCNVAGNGVTGDVIRSRTMSGTIGYSLNRTKGGDIEKLRKTAIQTLMHRKAQPAGQCINNACDLVSANPGCRLGILFLWVF